MFMLISNVKYAIVQLCVVCRVSFVNVLTGVSHVYALFTSCCICQTRPIA